MVAAFGFGNKLMTTELSESNKNLKQMDEKLHAFVEIFANPKPVQENLDLPLVGMTLAVKDLFDYVGKPTRAGSMATNDGAARETATAVKLLEDAGMIVVGKTHSVEFAFGGWGTNKVMGAPVNPWDLTTHRVAGGSSSGSAVSVASGMARAALGTDTGGSIRTPASFCGIVGVKTSTGLVSKHGVFALCPTHDSVGTLTRNVEDAAKLLNILVAENAPKMDFVLTLNNDVKGLKIATLDDQQMDNVAPNILQLYTQAIDILRTQGANIQPFKLPKSLMAYLDLGGKLMSVESYTNLKQFVEADDSPVAPEINQRILAGRDVTEIEYAEMLKIRAEAQREFAVNFAGFDALVMPTCKTTAIAVDEVDENAIVTPFGRFVNYLDLASISVPMGLADDGLPTGFQITVTKNNDPLALQIAQTIENQIGTFRPPEF